MLRLIAIAALAAALYTYGLDRVPAFLTLDETHFAVHAHALATTGRNLNGQVLPPLISLEDPEGETFNVPWGHAHYLPVGIYLIAAGLQVLPFDQAGVRVPSALVGGAVNVALLYGLALALFRNRTAAASSAILLALTPANFLLSRQALDLVCQLPFTIGGLWCLAAYLQRPSPRLALAAGLIFGLGIYAYVTSLIFMPLFLALFWLTAWRAGTLSRQAWLGSLGGFALALAPMLTWLFFHPASFNSVRIQYLQGDPSSVSVFEHLRTAPGAAIREFLRIYWSYFDPAFLFVQGGNARNISTGEVGVFLVPLALLLPIGVYALREQPVVRFVLLCGLLTAPLAAALKGGPYAIHRAAGLLIFASLIAGYGLARLGRSPTWPARVTAILLAVIMLAQFAAFQVEYHGIYRVASSHAFDPTAFQDAGDFVIAEDQRAPIAQVWIPAGHYDMSAKWRFTTEHHERRDLWLRTQYYRDSRDALAREGADTVVVVPAREGQEAPPPGWQALYTARTLMGEPTLLVLRRER